MLYGTKIHFDVSVTHNIPNQSAKAELVIAYRNLLVEKAKIEENSGDLLICSWGFIMQCVKY